MRTPAWKEVSLGEYVDLLTGFSFKSQQFTDNPNDIPLVKGANVHQGYIDWDDAKRWSVSEYDKYEKFQLQTDDVVVAMDRPWIEAGLKYAWIRSNDPKCLLVQRVARLRGINGLLTPYLRYLIGSSDFTDYIKPIVTGVNVPHISADQIKGFKFLLPPISVQQRIVDILSAYDRLIENNTRRIKILEEMARSLYDEWFVKFRFPGHEQTKLFDSELGLIPEGWEVKTFGDISLNFDRKRIPLSSIQRSKRQGEYRYYGASGVIDYIDDYIFDGKYLLVAEDGENLNSRKLPIAFLASGKFWVNNHAHIVQGKPPVSSELLCLFMEALDISGYITGAAQPKLSQSNLNRIPFILPLEQLLNRFNKIVSQLLNQVENLHRKNQNLQKTRDLLLPKLISGEIDVEKLEGIGEEGKIIEGKDLVVAV